MAKKPTASNPTRWSLIVRAQGSGAETRAALGELLSYYEKYVLWLIRHHKHPPDKSPEDLKQEFLEGMLRRNDIAKLDRAQGSFRGWLSLAVRRFLANEWEKFRAPRGGRNGTTPLTFEQVDLSASADDASTREFAIHVVAHALAVQRSEARDRARFDALVRFLPGPQLDLVEQAPLARELGMTQNALARFICLMRSRYRELVRDAIRDLLEPELDPPPSGATVATELACARAVDDELRELRRHFWS